VNLLQSIPSTKQQIIFYFIFLADNYDHVDKALLLLMNI